MSLISDLLSSIADDDLYTQQMILLALASHYSHVWSLPWPGVKFLACLLVNIAYGTVRIFHSFLLPGHRNGEQTMSSTMLSIEWLE